MREDGDVQAMDGTVFDPNNPSIVRLSAAQRAQVMQNLAGMTHSAAQALTAHAAGAGASLRLAPGVNTQGPLPIALALASSTQGLGAAVGAPSSGGADMGNSLDAEEAAAAGALPVEPPRGLPSPCLRVENLFTRRSVRNLDFGPSARGEDLRVLLKDDIVGAADRHGHVLHSALVEPADDGSIGPGSAGAVMMLIEDLESAQAAAVALAGRFYAGRRVRVSFVPLEDYLVVYPEARRRIAARAARQAGGASSRDSNRDADRR